MGLQQPNNYARALPSQRSPSCSFCPASCATLSDSSSLNTIDDARRNDWNVESCKAEIMIDAKNVLDTTRVLNMPLPDIPNQSSLCPTTQSAKEGERSQGDGEWMIEPNAIAEDFETVLVTLPIEPIDLVTLPIYCATINLRAGKGLVRAHLEEYSHPRRRVACTQGCYLKQISSG